MRKKILSIILTTTMVLGLIPCIPCVNQVKAESSWKLVWSDEFDGDSLNTNVWTRETGGSGWGNNELQYYTDRTDNSYVSDGTLKIVAKRENYSNCRFTSARLKTAGKKSFKYGKMEARIKVNGGNQDGVWPAFWMMGDDGTAWPWCGELDIMEHANSRNYVEGTIHWNAGGSSYNTPYNHIFWGSYSVPAYYYYSDNNNGINGWHTYGVFCDENTIKWYVDNNIYLTAYLNDDNAYAFRKNHYFLLNLALGSNATGYTGNTAPNDSFQSATMEVDYVRAYQRTSDNGTNSAKWTEQNQVPTYQITMKDGKKTVSNVNAYDGETLDLPVLSKKRYTFNGWYTSDGKEVTEKYRVRQNTTIVAKWTKVTVKQPKLTKLVNKKKGIIYAKYSVKGKKADSPKGYQIKYGTNKKLKKGKVTSTTSKNITIPFLKSGKTYYVKVRGYKLDSKNKKVFGKWSKIKSITVK